MNPTSRFLTIALVGILLVFPLGSLAKAKAPTGNQLVIASKDFTEAVILGEVMSQMLTKEGVETTHHASLGGTPLLWKALLAGEIDIYGDYTGTVREETLSALHLSSDADLAPALAKYGVGISKSLGFNNTYIIGMRADKVKKLGIAKISDLKKHPDLPLGFCSEFVERADGWPQLQKHYGLPQKHVVGMEHEITYRALNSGDIAATNLYSTDAEISEYGIVGLEDDRHLFPQYEAVYLYRLDSAKRVPALGKVLDQLAGKIPVDKMVSMNASVKLHHESEAKVAANFVDSLNSDQSSTKQAGAIEDDDNSLLNRVTREGARHLILVFVPLLFNILVALPLGVLAVRHERLGSIVLGVVNIAQTIPALALLVFLIPFFGVGNVPAMIALFIYGLLPIMKNTYIGIKSVPQSLIESADALGLSKMRRLWDLELPMAMPLIITGIKIAAVLNVGTATIGAIIGAGGFGEAIFAGVRHDDMMLLLEGAIPAALLAILIQGVFTLLEKVLIPRGLRIA